MTRNGQTCSDRAHDSGTVRTRSGRRTFPKSAEAVLSALDAGALPVGEATIPTGNIIALSTAIGPDSITEPERDRPGFASTTVDEASHERPAVFLRSPDRLQIAAGRHSGL